MTVLKYCLILSALALTACGELSYKRGGTAQEIEQAHRACRGSGDQLSNCLKQHGWQTPQMDAFDPLFATVSVTDNRQGLLSESTPILQASKDGAAAVAASKSGPFTTQTASPTQLAQAPLPSPTSPTSTVNDGPDTVYQINSWWKMGAFPEQLKKDQTSCEKKLGNDYLPDYATQSFKRGFVACMHTLGWMAVREVK